MSDYRQYGLARQEAVCVCPGHWIVDGHTIIQRTNRSVVSHITPVDGPWPIGQWAVFRNDENGIPHHIATLPSLRHAREFIYEHA